MKMQRRLASITSCVALVAALLAWLAGYVLAAGALHPQRLALSSDSIARADEAFSRIGATRTDFAVHPPDGALLSGWKVQPGRRNDDWVCFSTGWPIIEWGR